MEQTTRIGRVVDKTDDFPTICVVYATRGRPSVLSSALALLDRQTLPPAHIIVACTCEDDVAGLLRRDNLTVLVGPPGLARQRNMALDAIPSGSEVVVFFDDDFVGDGQWLEVTARAFRDHPDIVCVSGNVIADGIKGPGLTVETALHLIDAHPRARLDWLEDRFSPYGCNMAFRSSAIVGLAFDERLVLYGWQEDRDFGGMLARRGGRLVKAGAAIGVHLGVKAGRGPGKKLGYSQVVNPVYLMGKGTMRPLAAANHIVCNIGSNLVRAMVPESYVDRRGRLVGNLIGLRDLVTGRVRPERAEAL